MPQHYIAENSLLTGHFQAESAPDNDSSTSVSQMGKLVLFQHLDPAGKRTDPGRKSGIFCVLRRAKYTVKGNRQPHPALAKKKKV